MKTIELASLAAVSGGIAQNTVESSWSRPGSGNQGGQWNQPAPKWNAPAPTPTQPLGPFVPEPSNKQWA